MSGSVVPALIDALVAKAAAALPGLQVLDGIPPIDTFGDFLIVGAEDPEARGFELSADTTQEWTYANTTARSQEGDVTCAALSWSGDTDAKAVRDAAYATTHAVEQLLRDDPSLGLVPSAARMLVAGYGTRETLSQAQDDNGASAIVVFTVHFQARI